ncbi:LamG-like jellyroll fold domain-containing protein [Luteolibacter sp. LG18]|uniref:LamG-like jellyroll fold domain-containing protein n=1 Tax=Luteolibacter sp. LG18 TaxID=2819286 RepID=UPI002B315C5B|nr:hypothetical protein llg_44730 [Luteolibacter sp. LG18]
MDHDRLEFLLNRYFDQALAPDEKAEFEGLLLASSEARDLFWERSRWNSAIRQWAEEEGGRIDPAAEPLPVPQPARGVLRPLPRRPVAARPVFRSKPRTSHAATWALAAAAAVVFGFVGWQHWGPKPPAKAAGFAKLVRSEAVAWAEGASHSDGDTLRGEVLELKSGVVQLDFSRGARVVVEGPARFEILSDNSAALREGKLHATVPPSAHGFKVEAPGFVAVDYGTQFGCSVTPMGTPEVHVFEGAVGVAANQSKEVMLNQNHAVRLAGQAWDDIPARPDAFVNETTFSGYEEAKRQLEQWSRNHHELSNLPGTLVHYDFETLEGESRDTLVNRVPQALPGTNGSITGCHWTGGRWPGKRALEFNSPDDRVRLALPGDYPAMTFLASVRVANTLLRVNSLVRSYDEERIGEVHWFISDKETMAWSVRVSPRGTANQLQHAFSEPVIQGDAVGSWILLATVYDGHQVTHYLNGQPVGTAEVDQTKSVSPSQLDIGNGNLIRAPRSERETATNFSGCIDELAILSVPLSGDDIRRLYERNRQAQ